MDRPGRLEGARPRRLDADAGERGAALDPPPDDAGRPGDAARCDRLPTRRRGAGTSMSARPDLALHRAVPAARRTPRRAQRRGVVHGEPRPRPRRTTDSASTVVAPQLDGDPDAVHRRSGRRSPRVPLGRRALPAAIGAPPAVDRRAGRPSPVRAVPVRRPGVAGRARRRARSGPLGARRVVARDDDAPGRRPGDGRPRATPALHRVGVRRRSPAPGSPPCRRRSLGRARRRSSTRRRSARSCRRRR